MIISEQTLFSVFASIFGTMVGSFANVCIYRVPRELSVVHTRSHCIRCGMQVAWYDNLPLLSYVWLRGRCRYCGTLYGASHLLIELMVGLIALWIYLHSGFSFRSIYTFSLVTALLVASVIDLEHRIIPDAISIYGTFLGLFVAGVTTWLGVSWYVTFKEALLGSLMGGGLLWGVGLLYERITGREGIGFGDVKLLALFGAHAGVPGVLIALFFGSLFGSLAGLSLILFRGKGSRTPIPFGPFLCAGLLVYALCGQSRLLHYLMPW